MPCENWMSSMTGRTNWTRAMLQRLRELHNRGMTDADIANELFHEFGAPQYGGEVKAELIMLNSGELSPPSPFLCIC